MSKKNDTLLDWIVECGVGGIVGILIAAAIILFVALVS